GTMNPGVAASRQSAAIRGNNSQRRSPETPLRGVRFMGRSKISKAGMHLTSLRLYPDRVRHRRERSRDSAGQWRANFFGQLNGQVHVGLAFRPMNEVLDLARFVTLLGGDRAVHFGKRL